MRGSTDSMTSSADRYAALAVSAYSAPRPADGVVTGSAVMVSAYPPTRQAARNADGISGSSSSLPNRSVRLTSAGRSSSQARSSR